MTQLTTGIVHDARQNKKKKSSTADKACRISPSQDPHRPQDHIDNHISRSRRQNIVPLSVPSERKVTRSNDISTSLVLRQGHPLDVDTLLQTTARNQYSANRLVSDTHIDPSGPGTPSSAQPTPENSQPYQFSTSP